MNTNHMKEDQIVQAAAGYPEGEDQRHAGECVACGEEVRWLDRALANFHDSVEGYAARQSAALSADWNWRKAVARQRTVRSAGWAIAVLAVLLLLIAPVYQMHRQQQREFEAEQDRALMQQIDEAISSPVPDAMEPLAKLAAWNAVGKAQTQTSKDGDEQ